MKHFCKITIFNILRYLISVIFIRCVISHNFVINTEWKYECGMLFLFKDVASICVDSCDTFTHVLQGYFAGSSVSAVNLVDLGNHEATRCKLQQNTTNADCVCNFEKWSLSHFSYLYKIHIPDSKVHGTNMVPTWVLSAPDGPHVGPINLAIRDTADEKWWVLSCFCSSSYLALHFWNGSNIVYLNVLH